MADAVAAAIEPRAGVLKTKRKKRDRYYQWTAIVLLIFVLAGFGPTFFLRAFFAAAPIPAYLYVHGVVLTAWFVWLVLQTSLIQRGSVALHRKTGVAGAVIAGGVVIVGLIAVLEMVSRFRAMGVDWDTDMGTVPEVGTAGLKFIDFASIIVWGDLAALLVFAVLVASAILLRNRPEVHKRLILIATFNLIGPALARLAHWPALGGDGGPLVPGVILSLLLSLVVHDLVVRRRPHWATVSGIGLTLAAAFVLQIFVGQSEFGQAFIRSME